MTLTNHRFLLAARPVGMPKPSDWSYIEEPVAEPKDGELLVQVLYISLDPAMRGWMNEGRSYVPPVGIGELMRALGVGIVRASRNPGFAVGDHVSGVFGVQEYALTDGKGVRKIDAKLVPLPKYLSILGMTGMTAYFGLLDTGNRSPERRWWCRRQREPWARSLARLRKSRTAALSESQADRKSVVTLWMSWASTYPSITNRKT